jgi:hypothetical protein
VVTQPLSSIGESTTRSFLDVLSGVTTVSLVTANLLDDSDIREEYSDDLSEMSQRCRQLIEDEYSLEAAWERYERILNSIDNTR